MGSFSGLQVSFVPSWETVVACHVRTSADWATSFCGEQYLVWTWKSSGIGNGMRHILEGTERFLKAELKVRTPSKSRIEVSGLVWQSGFLPLGTWVREQDRLDSSASCLTSLSMGDPTWEEGQVTPQVLSWGNCQQKIQKYTEKAGEQPCNLHLTNGLPHVRSYQTLWTFLLRFYPA